MVKVNNVRQINPSLRFIERLEASQMVTLDKPADRTWCWIGLRVPAHTELRYPCQCAVRTPPTWSATELPEPGESFVRIATLRIVAYTPKCLVRQYFWFGQCSRCLKMYWGLARRKPKVQRPTDYGEWKRPRVVATMWHCGDDVCDCWQPVVQRYEPNRRAGYPWLKTTRLWEGTFHSEPDDEERAEMWDELKAATVDYRVESCELPDG